MSCPACSGDEFNSVNVNLNNNKTDWIGCDICSTWFHFKCCFNNSNQQQLQG
jgi:hypothetical protein